MFQTIKVFIKISAYPEKILNFLEILKILRFLQLKVKKEKYILQLKLKKRFLYEKNK